MVPQRPILLADAMYRMGRGNAFDPADRRNAFVFLSHENTFVLKREHFRGTRKFRALGAWKCVRFFVPRKYVRFKTNVFPRNAIKTKMSTNVLPRSTLFRVGLNFRFCLVPNNGFFFGPKKMGFFPKVDSSQTIARKAHRLGPKKTHHLEPNKTHCSD